MGTGKEKRSEVACEISSWFHKASLGEREEAEPKHPSEEDLLLRDTGLELCKGH